MTDDQIVSQKGLRLPIIFSVQAIGILFISLCWNFLNILPGSHSSDTVNQSEF